jgi:hypothetical protein
MLHSINGDRHVVYPVSCDVDKVDVVALTKLLISLGTNITLCLGQVSLRENLLTLVNIALLQVAETLNLDALEVGETVHCTRTTHSQTDETYSYYGDRLCSKSQHRLLALYACGLVKNNHAVLERVVLTLDYRSLIATLHYTCEEDSAEKC